MLIHVTPRVYLNPAPELLFCFLHDVAIPELGLRLDGEKDLDARRPYHNKRYLVACEKSARGR